MPLTKPSVAPLPGAALAGVVYRLVSSERGQAAQTKGPADPSQPAKAN